MKKNVLVSVSTDPIENFQDIVDYAKEMQGIADFLHCDVMDGIFVKRKTIDAQLVNNVNANSLIMLDVHLMCDEPLKNIAEYAKAGANIITVHYEAFKDKNRLQKCIEEIHNCGCLAGLAFNPQTSINEIKIYLYNLDLVLVMGVMAGASGQKFMPEVLEKIKELDKIRLNNNFSYKIEVDGGVNLENAQEIVACGADILVSGSFVFKSKDKIKAVKSLQNI